MTGQRTPLPAPAPAGRGPISRGHREQTKPAPDPDSPIVRGILHSLAVLGYCWTGNIRERDAAVAEYAWRHDAYWDRPGHLSWVVVSQTPCLREDLGMEDPVAEPWKVPASHTCRLKHIHAGSRSLVPGAPPVRGGG